MNSDMINMKETAEEAEFVEITPTSIKIQNAGLSGAHNVPAFDKAQYEANSTVDIDSLISTEAEQEQTPFDRIRGMMRHGNTKTLKSTALEAKRTAKRKAQRKARRAAR